MKKALVIVSGMLLILSGCAGLFFALMSFWTGMKVPHTPIYIYYTATSFFLTGPILIMAGGWLYSFKRAAWRLALVAHGIVLLYLIGFTVLLYLIVVGMAGPPEHFSLRTIAFYLVGGGSWLFVVPKGLLLLYGCSLSVLLVSRRTFKG